MDKNALLMFHDRSSAQVLQDVLTQETLYQSLAQALITSSHAILVTDLNSRLLYVNSEFERLFGFTQTQLSGHRPSEALVSDRTDKSALWRLWESLASFQPFSSDLLLYRSDHRPLWVCLSIHPVRDSKQNPSFYVIVLQDITQTKLMSLLQEHFLQEMVNELPLIEILHRMCREVELFYTQVRLALTLVDEKQTLRPLVSPSLPFFQALVNGLRLDSDRLSMSAAAWYRHAIRVDDIATHPFFNQTRTTFLNWGLTSCLTVPILSKSHHVLGTLTWFNTTKPHAQTYPHRLLETCQTLAALALERDYNSKRMYRLNFYDAATGLPNRQLLMKITPGFFQVVDQKKTRAAIYVVNIDHFKTINEAHGHEAGDLLLRNLAQRIRHDMGDDTIAARLSDDTFVIVEANCTTQQAIRSVQLMLKCIQAPLQSQHSTLFPNASIGISFYPTDGDEITTLIRHADQAMHRAKRNGRGGYHVYGLELDNLAQQRLDLDAQMRFALTNQDFLLVYQPQVYAHNTSHLYGVEALIRWRHPHRGEIPPADFIPLAEENGLIAELGLWVIRQVAQQLAAWRGKGLYIPRVAINLSPRQFGRVDLATTIFSIIAENQLKPTDLTLEVTECMMLNNKGYVSDNFNALIKAGFRISLDDFGTGYSSLSHLHRLPVKELKLDMSFVHDVEESLQAQALIHSVLEIGRSLNLHVVAEGVETTSQRTMLAQLGCEILQGYLFARPMPSNTFEEWVGALPQKQ